MRGNHSPLNGNFKAGIRRFLEEQSANGDELACANAWDRIGPLGIEFPGLLTEETTSSPLNRDSFKRKGDFRDDKLLAYSR